MGAIADQEQLAEQPRLIYFPVSFFSAVMGLCGLTIAWRVAGNDVLPFMDDLLALFTTGVMLTLSGVYGLKVVRHSQAVMSELHHPIKINFFPAFSISLLLLAVVWQDYYGVSHVLWLLGASVHFCLTLYVMSSWIHHTHYGLAHANPSWFIPVVGNIIAPIAGVSLGYVELSWAFFSIGIVFWLVLMTIVLYRLFFHEPLPQRLTPMLFILLAPPSVGFVSYVGLAGGIDAFGRVLYYVALFLGILLLSNILRFIKVPFFISSWAYSFPVAGLTIATAKMASLIDSSVLTVLAKVLLLGLTLLMSWLVVKTALAIRSEQICRPD